MFFLQPLKAYKNTFRERNLQTLFMSVFDQCKVKSQCENENTENIIFCVIVMKYNRYKKIQESMKDQSKTKDKYKESIPNPILEQK